MTGHLPAARRRLSPLVSRISRRLLPLLLLMYVLAFLDRTNIGFAKDLLARDAAIDDAAYAFGASLFFVGYALLEVPSNLLLVRFGPRLWLARIMVTWGLVAAATMFVRGPGGFYLIRTLLGIAEAGFFPGIIYYLVRFYPAKARARAIGLFYFGAPLSFIIGGPVSGLLLAMDGIGGIRGWQWLFLVQGVAASLVGVIAWLQLSDGPDDARWLAAEDKALLRTVLRREARAAEPAGHDAAFAFLRAPAALLLALIYALVQMTVYGLVFYLPHQIAVLLGREIGLLSGIVSAGPWIVALIAAAVVPRFARRGDRIAPVAACMLALAGGGLILSVATPVVALALVGLCCAAAGGIAVQPLFWTLAAARIGPRQAAAGIAFINSIGAAGAFLAPNLRVAVDAAVALPGAGLAAIGALAIAGAGLLAVIGWRRSGDVVAAP